MNQDKSVPIAPLEGPDSVRARELAIVRMALEETACLEWADRLVDALDGGDAEAARHAAVCGECKSELQLLWLLRMGARRDLGQKVNSRVLVERLRDVQVGRHPGIGERVVRWPIVLAAAAVFMVALSRESSGPRNAGVDGKTVVVTNARRATAPAIKGSNGGAPAQLPPDYSQGDEGAVAPTVDDELGARAALEQVAEWRATPAVVNEGS